MCADLEGTVVTVPVGVWNEFDGLYVSNAGLKSGEELTMLELLNCLLLQSANEAAVTIAAYYGREQFIAMMNEKAAQLGCTGTHFNNPHGAFYENHYTTARDLALITRWAINVPGFWEITQKSRYDKRATNMNDAVTLVTTNEMQDKMTRYYTSYIRGIKTGYTDEAGRCLVSAAQQGGMTYLLVILGAPLEPDSRIWENGVSSYTDTKLCYDWAFEHLALSNPVNPDNAVTEIKIRYAAGRDNLLLYPKGEIFVLGPKEGDTRELTYEMIDLPPEVKAPVNAGEVIATARAFYGGEEIGVIDLVTHEAIERDTFVMIMDEITDALSSTAAKVIYVVVLSFGLLYLYYVLIVIPNARRKQQKKRAAKLAARSGKEETAPEKKAASRTSSGKSAGKSSAARSSAKRKGTRRRK